MVALLPWENGDRTRIGRLRVRGGAQSAPLCLALSGMLDRADLRPAGVPPAAVLIVRRMSDPLPGHIAPQPMVGKPDAAWERAARDRLAGFYRHAARPGRDAVPADAEAVVFADEGELLASLALDLATGRMRERWWWRSLGGSLSPASPSALAALLCDRATWVPAALALLARQDRAVVVVRALSPREALAVATVVGRVHEASAAAASVASPLAPAPPDEIAAPRASSGEAENGASPAGAGGGEPRGGGRAVGEGTNAPLWHMAAPPPPWATWLPQAAVPAELDPAQRYVLGLALVLHYRPEAARGASFAAALHRWWQAQATAPVRSIVPPRPASPTVPRDGLVPASEDTPTPLLRRARPTPETVPSAQSLETTLRRASSAPSFAADRREPPPPQSPAPERASDPDPTAPDAPVPAISAPPELRSGASALKSAALYSVGSPPAEEAAAAPSRGAVLPVIDDPLAVTQPATVTVQPDWGLALEGGVETKLGGVLFLVNMMCALDLPECFEDEWRLASTVGAWGVLEALGRALLAAADANENDPIWPALAALSGRAARARLGAGLPRRRNYRLPTQWVAQMPAEGNEPKAWGARGDKLRLWSRAGYVLSETSRAASPAVAQARSEARFWGLGQAPMRARFADAPLAARSGPTIAGLDHTLRRWLSLAVPFIRLRLNRALGIDPAVQSLQEALLARGGRLYVTATHVDLVMGLETVSLPVRLAGLDRSPGWLGEFGRAILFHFE
jgi:hypothetical protein